MIPRKSRPEERRELRIEFLGEQDGPSERDLKVALRGELERHAAIKRAYLARIGFAPAASPTVALCLVPTSAEDAAIVKAVGKIFEGQFASGVPLDILFPSVDQEADLRRVCRPFFEAEK